MNDFLIDNEIQEIDLIKIDCEGAEFEILATIPDEILNNVRWIEGELHGQNDHGVFELLSKNFHLEFKKEMLQRCFNFRALNKKELHA